jgi:hypothetical protein
MPSSSPPPLRLLERPPHRRGRAPQPAAPASAAGGWAKRLRQVWQALRVPA